MNRTAERVLSVIGLIFTILGLIPGALLVVFGKAFSDGVVRSEVEMDLLTDPTLGAEDVELILSIFEMVGGLGWLFVAVSVISIVVTIIGIVSIWNSKNPKLAGAMFIIGGLFSFVLSLGSILLYIAAVLCFTKKTQGKPSMTETFDGDSMRPL